MVVGLQSRVPFIGTDTDKTKHINLQKMKKMSWINQSNRQVLESAYQLSAH